MIGENQPATSLTVVTGAYPPASCGVGDHCRNLALELNRQGLDTEVVVTASEPPSDEDGLCVRHLPTRWTLAGARQLSDRLAENSRQRPVLFQYVPHLYGRAGLSLGAALFPLLAGRRGLKVITHFHEVSAPWRARPLALAQALLHRAQAWLLVMGSVAVSFSTERYSGLMRFPLRLFGRLWAVLPSGPTAPALEVNDERCQRVRAKWAPEGQPIAVIYGLASRAKRYGLALGALDILKDRKIDLHLVMLGDQEAGDASYCREIRDAVTRLGLDDRVSWSGKLATTDVAETLAASDFLWHLNSGGLTLRSGAAACALAQGLPVIAFSKQGLDACFRDGDNVLLVKEQDSRTLADTAAKLLLSAELRARVRRGAEDLHREVFSWRVIGKAHVELMNRVGMRLV